MNDPTRMALYLGGLLVSVIFHEQAHAWVAWKLGDPTGKADKRLSWNPIHHIDPFMTILLPILTLVTAGFPFGGAKPVQINTNNFKNPALGWAVSAAAGPLANVLLAVLSFLALLLLYSFAPSTVFDEDEGRVTYNAVFFGIMVKLNLFLAAFNLLPLPGLDGSRVVRFLLPPAGRIVMDRLEPYGLMITILFVVAGLTAVLSPLRDLQIRLYFELFKNEEFVVSLMRRV